MHQPIKLYLLTGFLGAGKTTMLLSLLNGGGVAGKKIGVIQNEFGKLSIDGALLQRGDIEMQEISNGSIFCSCLKLQFVSALAEMSKQGLDMLFVESSGLADPSNLEEILAAVEVLCADQPIPWPAPYAWWTGWIFWRTRRTWRRSSGKSSIATLPC